MWACGCKRYVCVCVVQQKKEAARVRTELAVLKKQEEEFKQKEAEIAKKERVRFYS